MAWVFIIFIVIHVYLSFREDWLEKNGTMSSIFTGFKTEKKDKVETHGGEIQPMAGAAQKDAEHE
jgi:Ni/Fe-hydrogenase 1 B-type cytochrome subunit